MLISNLNEAENIVSKSPKLSWDGWNIIYCVQDDYAEYLSIGSFNPLTRLWYRKTTYPCTHKGWNLPKLLV